MITTLIRNLFSKPNAQIQRENDLLPRGIKSTIPVGGDYNEVWEHIHKTRLDLYRKNSSK